MKSRSKRSSSPLFQINWAFKVMVWGNFYFASALPFEQAIVAAHLSHLPCLWRVLSPLFLKMKKMNLAEGIASRLALFVVVLARRLAAGHVGTTQPKPAQNGHPEIPDWFLPSCGEILLGRSRPHKQK